MNSSVWHRIIYSVLIVFLVSLAYGLDFQWMTECEQTRFGEHIWFSTGDTLEGQVHSNSAIAMRGSPVFYDYVSTTQDGFIHGPGYAPQFLGPQPLFNTPSCHIPHSLDYLRTSAELQGTLFSPPEHHACLVVFQEDQVRIFTYLRGVPFDSSDGQTVSLSSNTSILFFECPIRVKGLITGKVIVISNSDIAIDDDIRYADSDSLTGVTPESSTNFLTLASMRDIKISNTTENGRENSAGLGRAQTDRNLSSIVITGALYALGESFTFECQNDPDSGYDFGSVDERGTINLYGGIVQHRRGYTHRSNRGGTGYLMHLRWDRRLHSWKDYIFNADNLITEDTLDMGDLPIGIMAWDTVIVRQGFYGFLGSAWATPPFQGFRIEPFMGSSFRIPVCITPTLPVTYYGVLNVATSYHTDQVVLRARGILPHEPATAADSGSSVHPYSFTTSLTASPNPFNLSTALHYTLPESGPARIVLYDLLGREVYRYESLPESAGEHVLQVNASGLTTGVYFAQLAASRQTVTIKLLLLK